jgi:predicted DNA-binding protein (MmcQ/YjbR family)
MSRSLELAVRELCLSLPEAEEFASRGSPNFRVRGRKVFAIYVLNHHGDGRVALWLIAADGVQQELVGLDPDNYFVPPYVGPSGWLGVRLDRGLDWEEISERVFEAWQQVAPSRLLEQADAAPIIAPPDSAPSPEQIDPLQSARAQELIAGMRRICLALPESSEGLQFGCPVWRAGKKAFAGIHAYEGPLLLSFWVGLEAQAMMTSDPRYRIPPYMGHNGWITLNVTEQADWDEIKALALDSYRHFALKRMLAQLGS